MLGDVSKFIGIENGRDEFRHGWFETSGTMTATPAATAGKAHSETASATISQPDLFSDSALSLLSLERIATNTRPRSEAERPHRDRGSGLCAWRYQSNKRTVIKAGIDTDDRGLHRQPFHSAPLKQALLCE